MNRKLLLLGSAFVALSATSAFADDQMCQSGRNACGTAVQQYIDGSGKAQNVDAAHPLPVSATVTATATIQGFAASKVWEKTPTSTSTNFALDGTGNSIVVDNTNGTDDLWVIFGNGSAVALLGTTPTQMVPKGQIRGLDSGGATNMAFKSPASVAVVEIKQGTGLFAGSGAGSSGGVGGSISNLPSTVATNSGNKDANTLRVVLATDQPALTNKILVTPDSVALPANQSVNMAQVAGTTTDTNSGNKSAGTLRVVLATDQPALTNKLLVTPDSVALPANQSVNEAQIAGVAPNMGAGAVSTGTERMTLGSDDPLVAAFGSKTDNKNTATDTTSVSGISLLKEISASSQTVAGSVGTAIPTQAGTVIIGGVGFDTANNLVKAPLYPNILLPSSTLTLPASTTAYTALDIMASSATAGSIVVPSWTMTNSGGAIQRIRLSTNDATSTAWGGKTVYMDLWSAAPTFTNGDNGAYALATGAGSHIAQFTCLMSAENGDGAFSECVPVYGSVVTFNVGTLYWTLESKDGSGVTGSAKVWTAKPETMN